MFHSALAALLALLAGLSPETQQVPGSSSSPVGIPPHAALATQSSSASTPPEGVRARNPRVVFVTSRDCPRCDEELARLRRPGGEFEHMQARGWKIGPGADNHLQIVDREALVDLADEFEDRGYPFVACIDDGKILRSFTSGCTTPLDAWTFGFLAKGIDERPGGFVPEEARVESTGNYPLRGNHWSVEDDWNPTRARVISHLRGPNHASQIRPAWKIEDWSYEELRSLHDNLHEQEMGGVSFSTRGSSFGSADQFGAGRKITGR